MWTVTALVLAGVLGITWHYTMRAHELVSRADLKAREEASNAAAQINIAAAERVRAEQANEEAERQKMEREKQEEIAKSMAEETARQQELNSKMGAETRLARVTQIMLPKARRAMEEREFPLSGLYAAVALGFRGFGYESLPDADKALIDSEFPPFFDPAEHPEFKRDFLRVIRGETRLLLPVWTALHTDAVNCVAYSPDGKFVATGSDDTTIRFWDVTTGSEMAVLAGHEREVLSLAFSPDMTTLASGSRDSSARLWDLVSRAERHKLEGHKGAVTGLAFSPNGTTLASASHDCTIRLWGRERRILADSGVQTNRNCLALSPDGRLVATGSHSTELAMTEWATGDARALTKSKGLSLDAIYSAAFSPDGRLLASGGAEGPAKEGIIRLWEVSTCSAVGVLRGHRDAVRSVAFSPDGETLASGSDDRMIMLWDLVEMVRKASLVGHSESVQGIAFSPCGNALVSASADKTVKLWDIAPTKEDLKITGVSSSRGLGELAFSGDGNLLSVGDGIRKLDDPRVDILPASLKDYSGGNMIFGPQGGFIAIERGKVAIWDRKGPEVFLNGIQNCHEMAFSDDGTVLATFGVEDGMFVPSGANSREYAHIQLWDVAKRKIIHSIRDEQIRVPEMFFVDEGKTLIAREDGSIHWFSVEKGEKIRTTNLPFAMDTRTFVTVSGDGSIAAGTDWSTKQEEVVIWDLGKDKERKRMTFPAGRRSIPAALSHDGKILAMSESRTKRSRNSSPDSIVLYDVESGEEIEELGGDADLQMVFSRDGRLLASRNPTDKMHDFECTIWPTAPTSPDLASYFLRGWYAFDQTTGEIVPAVPSSGGAISNSDRHKFLRTFSNPTNTVTPQKAPVVDSSAVPAPISHQPIPEGKPSLPLSRMEINVSVRKLSSRATNSFVRFRIDVRNGDPVPFIAGAVTVMLIGERSAGALPSLIWKEMVPLNMKPFSTMTVQSKTTDSFDLTRHSYGSTGTSPTYVGYVCLVQDSKGKVMAVKGSTSELEGVAEALLSLEVGESLKVTTSGAKPIDANPFE